MKRIVILALLLGGCASSEGIDRADQNKMVKTFYAKVESVKPVGLSSNVLTGTTVGATAGVIEDIDGNSEQMIAGGIAGALVGGIFTAIFEGSDDAYQYQLTSTREGRFSVVQKALLDPKVQCVKVRVGDKTTLLPVEESFCAGE